MNKEKPLSERQQNILNYIRQYVGENGRPPTIREIGAATHISSTSVVNYNLGKLEEKGLLDRDADVSRGLRLTEKAGGMLQQVATTVSRMLQVPMLGQIVAGKPIEVGNDGFDVFDEDDVVEVSAAMLGSKKPESLYALRVSGESMIDAMVNDGDIVIMQKQETAQNGDMVAVWIDSSGTTTLKHFYHEGKRVRLQPANPTMEPIYVPANDVRIQGKVMMVLRQTA